MTRMRFGYLQIVHRWRGFVTIHRPERGPALARSPDYEFDVAADTAAIAAASEELLRRWEADGRPIARTPNIVGDEPGLTAFPNVSLVE